ncbi:MAG: hypothetical protein WBV61_03875 [Rhodanobacteraceae bacterium]
MRILSMVFLVALFPVATQAGDGMLDPSFGNGGIVEIPWAAGAAQANAVGLDGSGRILVGGSAIGPFEDKDFALFRLLHDGTLDATYATDSGGFRLIDFDLDGIGGSSDDAVNDLAVLADGSVVSLGEAHFGLSGFNSQFALAKIDASGQLDFDFGSGGIAHFGFDTFVVRDQGLILSLDASDRILVGGLVFEQFSGETALEYWLGLARLTAEGALDTDFYGMGRYQSVLWTDPTIPPPRSSKQNFALGLTLDSDARVIVTGAFSNPFPQDAAIYRANPDGQFDAGFGPFANGRVRLNLANGQAGAAYALASSRMMVAGSFGANGPDTPFLVRLNADGTVDDTFAGGLAVTPSLPADLFATMTLLKRDTRGGWLLAGAVTDFNGSGRGVVLARFDAQGQPDVDFGNGGIVVVDVSDGRHFSAGRTVLQSDGKLVVAGSLPDDGPDNTPHFAVLRVLADYETVFTDGFDGELPP